MTPDELLARVAGEMTEAALQSAILALARTLYAGEGPDRMAWLRYHTHDSRRSNAGWPDLAMVRGPRLVVAELKTEKGRATPEQAEWLRKLDAVPGVETYLWRPRHWLAGDVLKVLQ